MSRFFQVPVQLGGGSKIRWPSNNSNNQQSQAPGRTPDYGKRYLMLIFGRSGQSGDYNNDLDSPTLPPRPTASASTSKSSISGDGGQTSSPPGRQPPPLPISQSSTSPPYNPQSYGAMPGGQTQTSPKRWNIKGSQQAAQQDRPRWGVKFNHSNTTSTNQSPPPKPPLSVC